MDTLAKPAKTNPQQPGGNVGSMAAMGRPGAVDAAHVARLLTEIRDYMPQVYKAIQAKAAPDQLGNAAFSLVRRALRGEANCFYASEGGRTVGAPFVNLDDSPHAIMAEVALAMVCFGARHWVVWQQPVAVAASAMPAGAGQPNAQAVH